MERVNVRTIPMGAPFLPALADALLSGDLIPGFPGTDPLALASATIYLPTRRAARALAQVLAERAGPKPSLLPRILPLGDSDAAEFLLAATAAGDDHSLAPAIPETGRQIAMASLVLAWTRQIRYAMLADTEAGSTDEPLLVGTSPADALALARDLIGLMDSLAIEEIGWEAVTVAAGERYDPWFSITTRFLEIAARTWPDMLAERGASDPARRRDALIRGEAARLRAAAAQGRDPGPMIVAGSTGSVPATAQLIAAVARLPRGVVVLPGLDTGVAADVFASLTAEGEDSSTDGHPQVGLARLLETIGIDRDTVASVGTQAAQLDARARFLGEALRPAEATDAWSDPARRLPDAVIGTALNGMQVIVAADEREEALAIAVAIRETLETPGRTAALVTPDRVLAERVAAELARWKIEADDSAGRPLARVPGGVLARLVAQVCVDWRPQDILALVAHPLARFGLAPDALARACSALEIGALRGPAPAPGIAALRAALASGRQRGEARHAVRPLARLGEADWQAAEGLIDALERMATAFPAQKGAVDLVRRAANHRDALAIAVGDATGMDSLSGTPDGEALATLFDDLALVDVDRLSGGMGEYPSLFAALAEGVVVRTPVAGHPRVRIWGPLEARLLSSDRIVLGGLDEGVWPQATRTDAFLNRPLRAVVGLPSPERRIGQSAHDFVQALGTPDAVLTRARKREGAPCVPSRFLQRMQAYAGEQAWNRATKAGDTLLALARALDRPVPVRPIARPAPILSPEHVPDRLSVTEVETLFRDPYAIYARRVLGLDALDPLAQEPDASDRGQIVHAVLGAFAQQCPGELAADARESLVAIGEQEFARLDAFPEVQGLWWTRFEQLVDVFLEWERARRPGIDRLAVECPGEMVLPLPDGGRLSLRARADRIEIGRDGLATIVDFKTGQLPSNRQVCRGLSPQLTLEAAMLAGGAFPGLTGTTDCTELLYVKVAGAREPLLARKVAPPSKDSPPIPTVIADHVAGLCNVLAQYRAGTRGFVSRAVPMKVRSEGDYDHLARVREWSRTGGVEDDGPGEENGQ